MLLRAITVTKNNVSNARSAKYFSTRKAIKHFLLSDTFTTAWLLGKMLKYDQVSRLPLGPSTCIKKIVIETSSVLWLLIQNDITLLSAMS